MTRHYRSNMRGGYFIENEYLNFKNDQNMNRKKRQSKHKMDIERHSKKRTTTLTIWNKATKSQYMEWKWWNWQPAKKKLLFSNEFGTKKNVIVAFIGYWNRLNFNSSAEVTQNRNQYLFLLWLTYGVERVGMSNGSTAPRPYSSIL